MDEVLLTYFFLLIAYPLMTAMYALELPLHLAAWLGVGASVLYVLYRFKLRTPCLIWVAIWFMPGTLMCGAAALVPWPFAVFELASSGQCTSMPEIAVCLALNLCLMFGAAFLRRRCRQRRSTVIQQVARMAQCRS